MDYRKKIGTGVLISVLLIAMGAVTAKRGPKAWGVTSQTSLASCKSRALTVHSSSRLVGLLVR